MKLSSILVAALFYLIHDGVQSLEGERECKPAISEMIKLQLEETTKCIRQLGFRGKERTEKMNCILKCTMMASGVFNPDGSVKGHVALAFVLQHVPLNYLDKALKGSLKCLRFMNQADPDEATCNTYDPLIRCMTGFIMTLCDQNGER